jgi:hypothetical protein
LLCPEMVPRSAYKYAAPERDVQQRIPSLAMPLCAACDAAVWQDYHETEYTPLCAPCISILKRGVSDGDIVTNETADNRKIPCSVCRRVCCHMRVGDRRPMCRECYGWWKLCAQDDAYVAASRRLFERLDAMGMGHLIQQGGRRLLTRKEHNNKYLDGQA